MRNSVSAGIVLSCVALLTSAASVAADSYKCGLTRYASLALVTVGDSYLLVPVTIQGTRAYMVLNMASPFSSVTEKTVHDLSLPTKSIPFNVGVHAGKSKVQDSATATPFAVGELQFKSADFLVFPQFRFPANMADAPVVGVLGMDVFKQVDIELDAAHRKMNLFSQDHCPKHVVYWSAKYDSAPIRFGSLGEFYFPMELDGKKLETTLATSNSMTTLRTDATRKLFNFDSHSTDVETVTDSSGNTTAHYRAMKLSGEGLDIFNARISLVDPPTAGCYLSSHQGAASYEGCYGVHPLALGRDVVSKLHFYIATKEKMLYFTPAEPSETSAAASPAPVN
jgi:Aspartyl protease